MSLGPQRLSSDERDRSERDGTMGLLEHLDELRSRLIRACIAVAAGMGVLPLRGVR